MLQECIPDFRLYSNDGCKRTFVAHDPGIGIVRVLVRVTCSKAIHLDV